MKILQSLFLAWVAIGLLACTDKSAPNSSPTEILDIVDGVVHESPPTSPIHAAYAVLRNNGDQPVIITSVVSEKHHHAALHQSVVENGVAKMLAHKTFVVPANGELVLKPHSYHLMLHDAKGQLVADDNVKITLETDQGNITHSFVVKKK